MRRSLLTCSTLLACTPTDRPEPFLTSNTGVSVDGGVDSDTGDDTSSTGSGESTDTGGPPPPPTTTGVDTSDGTGSSSESTTAEIPDVCGDGMLGPNEACDGELFDDVSCAELGFSGGVLVCSETCQGYSSAGCFNCGNGTVEGAEDCEEPVAEGFDCSDAGYTAGAISCDLETCQYDTSNCSTCGNGMIEGDEPCDGNELMDTECSAIGFDSGSLACTADCNYDVSGCEGGNYTQNFDGGVIPPEFSHAGNANWVVLAPAAMASLAAASGDINDNGTSTINLVATFDAAGTVEFLHTESTESNYDYLEFWIDNVMMAEWSGQTAPAMAAASYPVLAGQHTLSWRYTKDISVSSGSDRVWVDDIVLTNGWPSP